MSQSIASLGTNGKEPDLRNRPEQTLPEKLSVRTLTETEIPSALDLAWRVFLAFEGPEYSAEGIYEFRKSIRDPEYLSGLRFYGAFAGTLLAGVAATRTSGTHIALLFVDGNHHRQGIGKALFLALAEDCSSRPLTVNSSPYAVGFYRSLGFRETAAEQNVRGLRFTPMAFQ